MKKQDFTNERVLAIWGKVRNARRLANVITKQGPRRGGPCAGYSEGDLFKEICLELSEAAYELQELDRSLGGKAASAAQD